MSGLFITFEGGEGSGKSTQLSILAARLESAGFGVRRLREPGGTHLGELVRSILLDPENSGMDARAELFLYEAARAQLVAEVIEPALEAGEIVICDRFYDSTTAYQGFARELPLDDIYALNRIATGCLVPDRTLVFDIAPEVGVERATSTQEADRLEMEHLDFHRCVRDAFLSIAEREPVRVKVIDAGGSIEEVSLRVNSALADLPQLADALG